MSTKSKTQAKKGDPVVSDVCSRLADEGAILKAAVDERAASRIDAIFDKDTQRLVRIFQNVFHLSHVERDQVKYVKRYAWQIEWAGRLFQFLHLAKRDKRSPLGWRPTPLLLDLMNKQPARKSKPSRKPIPMLNRLIVNLLQDAVIGDERHKVSGGVLSLGFKVLQEVGLMRRDPEGDMDATPRLLLLFAEAYYDRLADEMAKGDYPY